MPGSVIGNTSAFGAEFPGSSPGRATKILSSDLIISR